MINITNKSNMTTTTNAEDVLLDDNKSLKSSTEREKRTRKPLERSTSRNSPMRETSQNALKGIDFKKLFVKRNSLTGTQQKEQNSPRNTIMHRNEQNRRERKRCPTPVPGNSRKTLEDKKNNPQRQRDAELQNDIFIAELQRHYYEEKEKRQSFQKDINIIGNKLKVAQKRIDELEKQLRLSQLREKEQKVKISELNYLVDKKQSNLYEARSNLQKMKRQIKESRIDELTFQNSKLRKEKQEIKNTIQVIEQENELLYGKCKLLDDQIYELRKANNILSEKEYIASKLRYIDNLNEIVTLSKNDREQFLQKIIHQKQEDCLRFKSIISKLEIRINFMNRRSNQTIQQFKTKKIMDLKNLRNTLSCIVKQNHNLKKETEKLKKKISSIVSQQVAVVGMDSRTNDDDRIELKLSPDHSDT